MEQEQYEQTVRAYINEMKQSRRNSEKYLAMICLADTRLQQYLETGDSKARRLAGNSYIASRMFFWKSLGINVSEITARKPVSRRD